MATHRIVEPIGQDWTDELIWLPTDGPAFAVIDAAGRTLTSQPAGRDFAEPPSICVKLNLAANQELALDVRSQPPQAATHQQPGEFSVTPGEKFTEITTTRIAVRIPADQWFDPGEAPGPILSLRRAADTNWTGRGAFGPTSFMGRIETKILDRGPLYARWITQYIVGGITVARYDVRLVAGEDFLILRDRSPLDQDYAFRFALTGDDAPKFWFTHGGGEMVKVSRGEVATTRPDPQGDTNPNRLLHIDFHSGHFQGSLSWAGLWRDGGPVIGVCQLDASKWEIPGRNRISAWKHADDGAPRNSRGHVLTPSPGTPGEGRGEGAFALIASEKRPHPDPLPGYREREAEAARQKDQLHPADGIVWEFPARGGAKSFALTCGDPAAFAPAEGLSRMCDIRRKFSDVPLEKVRHWVTKWDLQKHPRPITYPAGTAENYQQKLKAWPQLEKRLHETAPKAAETWYLAGALLLFYLGTAPPNPACRAKLFKYIDDQLDAALAHILTNGYIRFIIFDGRSLKVILEAIDVLRWKGEIDQPKLREWSRKAAFLAYAFHDQDFWPYDAFFHARTDQRGHGEEFWSNQGDIICPPNFTTEYWTSFLLAGLTFPEHPAANCWIEKGEEMFARNLDTQFYESGGYSESANYHDHEMQMLTQVAVALLAQGRQDFFEHPRFKKNFGFFIDMITPPVKLTAAARPLATDIYNLSPASGDSAVLLTNWGNSGHDCSGHVLPQPLAVAAGIYADRDPAYARRLMTAWRNSTQKFATSYTGFNLLALGRPDLPETDLHLDSALVEGLGAVMRANVGTPREIFGWIKNGPATHHNCRDDGGLVLYAHGAPVIGDLGYHCQHQGRQEGSFETWKHACVSFDGKTTSMLRDVEFTLPPELWRSTPQADLLVTYAPVDRLLHAGDPFLNPRIVTRIEHRRFTLFMKPDYFVIYDHIPQTTVTSTYWLPALADSIDISAGRAHFHGQFGVDLHLLVLLPAAAKIESGEYSVMRHVRIDQPGAGDYLTVISALPKGEKPPTAKWDASSRMLTVQTGQSEDKIFLSPDYITAPGAPTPIRVAIQRAGQWLSLDSKERNG